MSGRVAWTIEEMAADTADFTRLSVCRSSLSGWSWYVNEMSGLLRERGREETLAAAKRAALKAALKLEKRK